MVRSERSQLAVMTHLPNSALGNTASKLPMGPIFVSNMLIPQVTALIFLLLFTSLSLEERNITSRSNSTLTR